jgi:hypothetical protein
MDNIKAMRGWIVGQGLILDMGVISEAEAESYKTMSPDARKIFVDEFIAKYPEAFKLTAGNCAVKRCHVKETECITCARNQGYKTLAEWDMCRGRNLSRI